MRNELPAKIPAGHEGLGRVTWSLENMRKSLWAYGTSVCLQLPMERRSAAPLFDETPTGVSPLHGAPRRVFHRNICNLISSRMPVLHHSLTVNNKFEGNPHLCGLKKHETAKKIQSEADAASSVCESCPVSVTECAHRHVQAQAHSRSAPPWKHVGSTCEACLDDTSALSTALADARKQLDCVFLKSGHKNCISSSAMGTETGGTAPAYPTLTNGACAGELGSVKRFRRMSFCGHRFRAASTECWPTKVLYGTAANPF